MKYPSLCQTDRGQKVRTVVQFENFKQNEGRSTVSNKTIVRMWILFLTAKYIVIVQ